MKKPTVKTKSSNTALIAQEYQNLIKGSVQFTVVFLQTREVFKGTPLQLSRNPRILNNLPKADVLRLGYLASVQYQEQLSARKKSLK